MLRLISSLKSITILLAFLVAFVLNLAFEQPWLGLALSCFYFIIFAPQLGANIAPKEHWALRAWIGLWILISAIMVVGSLVYYLFAFPAWLAQALVLLTPPIIWMLSKKCKRAWFADRAHDLVGIQIHSVPKTFWISSALILIFLFLTVRLLAGSATLEAVRSLWDTAPHAVALPFFAAILLLTSQLMRGRERSINFPLTIAALFVFLSGALLVFPLGFGFDSFIHQATQSHIAEFGSISPKPLYYIGQYVLVLFTHHAFFLPVEWIDKLLVPISTSLLLPLAWYGAASHLFKKRSTATASVIGLFLIPLASFIVTTPQALANLWTLLIILAAVPHIIKNEKPHLGWLAIPALACVCVHPIAGIPSVLLICLVACDFVRQRASTRAIGQTFFWITAALGSFALPISFLFNKFISGQQLALTTNNITPTELLRSLHLELFFDNRFQPLLDFVYLYAFNAVAIVIVFAGIGWWLSRKIHSGLLNVFIVFAVILLINFTLLSTAIDFSFLINYERQNYAARLIPLALFALSPLLIIGFGTMLERVRHSPVAIRAFVAVAIAATVTSAFYLAYPRDDAYERSHGFNVSIHDVNAVYAIEQAAAGKPYIALANQSVSATAMKEIGFRYFGDQFFYPIPTGGELYQFFLDMNDKPSRETAEDALRLVDDICSVTETCEQSAQTLYYVVDDYWWQAPRIVETAKSIADNWFAIGDGRVHVFEFIH